MECPRMYSTGKTIRAGKAMPGNTTIDSAPSIGFVRLSQAVASYKVDYLLVAAYHSAAFAACKDQGEGMDSLRQVMV